jgi:hypothetical protein
MDVLDQSYDNWQQQEFRDIIGELQGTIKITFLIYSNYIL